MKKSLDIKLVKLYLGLALGYFFFGVLNTWAKHKDGILPVLLNNAWAVVYLAALNFILFEISIPFVTRKRKAIGTSILLAILLSWVHLMLYSYGSYVWRLLGIRLGIYTPLTEFSSLGRLLENLMGYSTGSVFFFGIIRHIYNYVKLKQASQQLRIEKQQAELNYLKSQTNPHFLFNTLNNIYSLARDKSDLAPESIMRLSKILRYMLYETNGEYIAIEQELKIMNDYIALEKLRYDETLQINFNYDIEELKQSLPPLLLMPLIENAFKHGVSESRDKPFVDIHLSVNKRQLEFIVKNSSEELSGGLPVKENIGLANLRRQLELLYTDFSLAVHQRASVFTAILKINLASHV